MGVYTPVCGRVGACQVTTAPTSMSGTVWNCLELSGQC